MKKKIAFNIHDETFKVDWRNEVASPPVLLDVDISDIKQTSKYVTFKCDIPDWIYNRLLDSEDKYLSDKFTKRISETSLGALHTRMEQLSKQAQQLFCVERLEMKPVRCQVA